MNCLPCLAVTLAIFGSLASAQSPSDSHLDQCRNAQRVGQENLKKFDDLNFGVYLKQDWARFRESHHDDVVVTYPDGSVTHGLAAHLEPLKWFFTFAPDTRITAHPIRFATGEWTAVEGVMEGTFTKPMTLPNGKVYAPNGKRYRLTMATLGHWKDGKMTEEHVFADNGTIMRQLSIPE
jgi:predicted ester cyclase